MSLIDKKNLNYFTTVEQYFLSLTESGLSLSARDYQLIDDWELREVPLATLCRAIEKSFSKFQSQMRAQGHAKISLVHLKSAVEDEIERSDRP